MVDTYLKGFSTEKKNFYVFLVIHLLVWTILPLIRTVLPTDALEGIYWGSFYDFGTPKHPPLAGWLTYLAFIPFKSDFCVYLISQLFIFFGFVYIYRLAKYFLDETGAMLSVVLLEGTWCYSYITGYYGFNPDVILLFTLPAIAYYFYNCMKDSKPSDWLKLGLITGLSFLNKYQTALLLIPMFIWALFFNRSVFKNKFFYISVVIAAVIFFPHLLWLIKHDFYSLMYFEGELTANSWFNHISAPVLFLLMQIAVISGSLLLYVLLKVRTKSSFKFIQNFNKKDFYFILLLGLTPLVVHLLMGIFAGGTMRPRWGYEFWFMTGIMLFYFFPCNKLDKSDFNFTLKSAYIVMLVIFLSLGTLLAVEKNYRSRYPVTEVFNFLEAKWIQQVNKPLKYVGGYIEWTLPLTVYGKTHPDAILDNHGYKDPWLDIEDIKKSGVMIIDRHIDTLLLDTKAACPYLPKDYHIEPIEYKFFVHNALGMKREYTVYYAIIPPM